MTAAAFKGAVTTVSTTPWSGLKGNAVQLDPSDDGDRWSGRLGRVGVSGAFDVPFGHLPFDQSRA